MCEGAGVMKLAHSFFCEIAAKLRLVSLLPPVFLLVGIGAIVLHAFVLDIEAAGNILALWLIAEAGVGILVVGDAEAVGLGVVVKYGVEGILEVAHLLLI